MMMHHEIDAEDVTRMLLSKKKARKDANTLAYPVPKKYICCVLQTKKGINALSHLRERVKL